MVDSRQDKRDWRRLYPFTSHWAEVSGGRMHCLDERPADHGASQPTLLFVHGNPTWSFHWRRMIASWRSRYRCVAIDHLGCGLSDKPHRWLTLDDHIRHLVEFIHSTELTGVTLVAQDWGGAIGLGAMLRCRDRLERIILFNTGAFPPDYIPWRIAACRIPLVGRLAVQGGNLFSRAALRMTLARTKGLEPAVEAGYLAPYDRWRSRRAVYGFVRDIPKAKHRGRGEAARATAGAKDTRSLLAQIEKDLPLLADVPSCLVWGMRDWCFRPDCLERFLAAWPQAEVHRLSDVGHWVVEDAPDESQRIVESFLSRDSVLSSIHRDGVPTRDAASAS